MADGTTNSQNGDFSLSWDDVKSISIGMFDSAVDFQEAATMAAKGDYDSAINTISQTYSRQASEFSAMAARAEANGNAAAAARFTDWSQRMAAQSASIASDGAGAAESVYSDYVTKLNQNVEATKGAFSNPAVKKVAGAAGLIGDGIEIFQGWEEHGWAGAAQQTGGALASAGGSMLAIAVIALLPYKPHGRRCS